MNPATHLLLAPVVVPVAAALLLLVFPRPGRARRIFASGALLLVFASALWMGWIVAERGGLAIRLGSWPRPMAIVLALDALSATFLSFVSLTALVCVLHGFAGTPTARAHPLRLPLAMLLLAGVNLTLMTADLFNMFVAFEVMLVSSYALLTLETDDRRIRRAIPYLKINIIGSTLFLAACGLTYGWLGTLDLGSVSLGLEQHRDDPRTAWLAALLLLVVGIKSAIFPLFYWLPRSYPALPPALAALFGGLLTKIGIYVMIRLLVTVFPSGLGSVDGVLLPLAAITMVLGGLGAISRSSIRSILSWHIVSQIGFMVTALALRSTLAITAAIAIALHNVLVKSSLLLCGGTIRRLAGTDELPRIGHLARVAPWLAVVFFLQALSLAGLPPLSGFWGKLMLFRAGFDATEWVVLAAAAVAGFLTLASMLKIWLGAFWGGTDEVEAPVPDRSHRLQTALAGVLVVAALAIGIGAEGFLGAARASAEAAQDRDGYVRILRGAAPGSADSDSAAGGRTP